MARRPKLYVSEKLAESYHGMEPPKTKAKVSGPILPVEHTKHMKEHHKHMKAHMKHLDGYMKKMENHKKAPKKA